MGQIAEDMISGCCCALCGQYFQDKEGHLYEHGYPVSCLECWDKECGYPKSETGIETM